MKQGVFRKIQKAGFVVRTKQVTIYHDKHGVEVYFHLGGRRGLYLNIDELTRTSFEVMVLKAVDGCPGSRKADFHKVYRKSRK